MNNVFSGKTMEIVRDRANLVFISLSQRKQIIKRQSKLNFKGIVNWYSTFTVSKFEKQKKKKMFLMNLFGVFCFRLKQTIYCMNFIMNV